MTRENEAITATSGGRRLLRAAWWTYAVAGLALNWVILAPIVREVWQLQP